MDRWVLIAPLMMGLALGGCAHVSDIQVDRLSTTGIDADERVAVILELHEGCNTGESSCRELRSQREFEDCLGGSLRGGKSKLTTLPAEEFVRKAFFGTDPHDVLRTSEALLERTQDAEFRQTLAALKLHYIIVLKVRTIKTTAKPAVTGDPRFPWFWAAGAEWSRYSNVSALILDAKEARLSGKLASRASGKQGFVMPVVAIVPLPPVLYSSMTETSACEALGQAVAKLILEKE